jgi:hypothetical protein
VRAIAVDPSDYNTAIVADANNKVWITNNAGATAFQDITGNLPLTNLRSVIFMRAANNVLVALAGGQGGVYAAGNGEFNIWTQVGGNLPAQAFVYDIKYNSRADVLCIAPFGRGAFTLPSASTIFGGAVLSFTSIVANSGPIAGGNTVTINGTGFSGVPTVMFDANAATGVSAVTSTSFTCVVPASAGVNMGGVDVKVNSGGQTATRINAYTYINAPTITGLTPAEGVVTGGTTVTITGLNFTAGAVVMFGANAATGVVVNAANQITCVSPAGVAPGAVQVTVTAQGATTAPAMFTYLAVAPPAPTITNITPASGPATGGTPITITGTGFNLTPNSMSVSFGGMVVPTGNIMVASATTMTLVTPPGMVNPNVPVIASDGGTASAPFTGFAYTGMDAPMVAVMATVPEAQDPTAPLNPDENGYGVITITLLSPVAVGSSVTIGFELSGNARPGSDYQALGGNSVTIDGPDRSVDVLIIPIHRTTIVGPETVTLTIMTGPKYLVGPQNSATVTIEDINQQTVGKVVLNSGSTAGGDTVQIQGSNFLEGMKVFFNGVLATNVEVLSDSLIMAMTPPGTVGAADVTVDDEGIASTLTAGYTYVAPPLLSSIAPNAGTTAGGTSVTLTGANYATGATVTFNGVAATNVVVVSATSITCTTPPGAAGVAAIAITVKGLTKTFAALYTYISPPVVLAVTPNFGLPAGGNSVTITGVNFVAGSMVLFGGNPAVNVMLVTANTITCVTPAGTGMVDVSVISNGMTTTLANAFTYFDSNVSALSLGRIVGKFGKKPSTDTLVVNGNLPIPLATKIVGNSVKVVIGDFSQVYILGKTGKSPDKNNIFTLSLKQINGYTAFKLVIRKQDLFSKLTKLGFVKTKDAIVSFPVAITIDGVTYRFPKLVAFFARSGVYNAK